MERIFPEKTIEKYIYTKKRQNLYWKYSSYSFNFNICNYFTNSNKVLILNWVDFLIKINITLDRKKGLPTEVTLQQFYLTNCVVFVHVLGQHFNYCSAFSGADLGHFFFLIFVNNVTDGLKHKLIFIADFNIFNSIQNTMTVLLFKVN